MPVQNKGRLGRQRIRVYDWMRQLWVIGLQAEKCVRSYSGGEAGFHGGFYVVVGWFWGPFVGVVSVGGLWV